MHPVCFHGQDYKKQRVRVTNYHILFGLQNMFQEILFIVILQ